MVRIDRAALAATLLVAALAGCTKDKESQKTAAKGSTRVRYTSGGAVVTTWTPPSLSAVKGVPAPAIQQAITARLGDKRPAGLMDDQWRHTKTLYKRFGGGPLWLNDKGLDEARARSLL